MKVYAGDRTIDGVKVTVDGAPLDPCVNVEEFTKNGFEWSYEGPEPRQLALALLIAGIPDAGAMYARRVRKVAEHFAARAIDDHHVSTTRHEHAPGRGFDGNVVRAALAFNVEFFNLERLRVPNSGRAACGRVTFRSNAPGAQAARMNPLDEGG